MDKSRSNKMSRLFLRKIWSILLYIIHGWGKKEMIKCTHCIRYFVMNLSDVVENGYVRCPYCGELIKL